MKILFGIQGTGNGHISRARILVGYLKQQGAQVQCLVSGRDKDQLFDMEVFGDFWHRKGLTFISKNGKIDYWQSFKQNSLLQFFSDIKNLNLSPYDLIITDFEPVTAWAAKRQQKHCIGIGHQYAFGQNTPLAGDNAASRWIMRNFAPTKQSVGLHWHPYSQNVLPPIIDTKLSNTKTSEHIVVYLPFENSEHVCRILTQFKQYKFKLYAPNISKQEVENVSLHRTAYQSFKNDLASAQGVICNSGFELISECLHLGLPILTKPLQGQMEQHSNALSLQQLNFATVIDSLDPVLIEAWLKQRKEVAPRPLPDVAKHIANWITEKQWQQNDYLAADIWQNTLTS